MPSPRKFTPDDDRILMEHYWDNISDEAIGKYLTPHAGASTVRVRMDVILRGIQNDDIRFAHLKKYMTPPAPVNGCTLHFKVCSHLCNHCGWHEAEIARRAELVRQGAYVKHGDVLALAVGVTSEEEVTA